jgi:hypothetical protein
MTARGPGQGDVAPNLVAMNAHVLLSKARHNRKSEMMALLDDPDKELHVDVADEAGNSVLIIACQVRALRVEAVGVGCGLGIEGRGSAGCECRAGPGTGAVV